MNQAKVVGEMVESLRKGAYDKEWEKESRLSSGDCGELGVVYGEERTTGGRVDSLARA